MIRLIEPLEDRVMWSVLTANFNSLGAPLNKPGLGALFAVTATNGGPDLGLLHGSTLNTSVPADAGGTTSTSPFSLANVAPILRKAGVKTIVRYADMLSGFPYTWVSLANWDSLVQGETTAIKNSGNGDVVRAVAPFNEPDDSFAGAFMTDPALPSGTYDQKVNYLWTHTVQEIKAIDSALPIMGPDYVSFYPQRNSVDLPRMKAFLQNAIATNTVPDIMGWHQLYGGTAADYGVSLSYYRTLEASLGLAKLPLEVEEYGVNNGQFAGIPSSLIPYWAEYERDGVSYASAGVYDNGGTLGNEIDYYQESNQQPNAGWWAANWYMNMSGVSVPTTAASTRYTGAYEGIASYNAASRTGTLLLGGPDDQATINLNGVGKLIGGSVRVQLLDVRWTTDTNEPNSTEEHGGDPVYAPTTILNNIYTPDASGNITVNFHLQNLNGYEMLITPATADTTPRYEAENALGTDVTTVSAANRSNGAYVSGIANADSALSYTVIVPDAGTYLMNIAYGVSGGATQTLVVNGVSQPYLSYATTGGGLATAESTTQRSITLVAGVNTITFAHRGGTVDQDYITIAPTVTSKYEAEAAVNNGGIAYTNGPLASGGGYVSDIAAGDSLSFNVVVPAAGLYDMNVRYAAGDGTDTQNLTVNGASEGQITYPQTNVNAAVDLQMTTQLLALRAGTNVITFTAGTGLPELDFVDVQPDTHRYEAETATINDATAGHFPNSYTYSFADLVGGINNTDSYVSFQVDAPIAAAYTLQVQYGNGGSNAADSVIVDGLNIGNISLPKTAAYLSGGGPTAGAIATLTVMLAQGENTIQLTKVTNYAELNYINLLYPAVTAPGDVQATLIATSAPPVKPPAQTAPPSDPIGSLILKADPSILPKVNKMKVKESVLKERFVRNKNGVKR